MATTQPLRRKAVRIGVIGAGSAQFSLGLVRDLCLTESLAGSQVVFMDIDAERLNLVGNLAARYAREIGADLRFEQTLDREAALRDADFVINTALIGSHDPEEDERRVSAEHGYYRGLYLNRFHQYGLMLSVAQDMERICPDAWLIQASNPVFEGCTLMARQTGIKLVGLCHGPHHGIRDVCRALEIDPEAVEWQAPGFNHVVYMTQFRYRGADAYPLLDDWIANKAEAYWQSAPWRWAGDVQMSPGAIHQYQRVGLLPLGDTPRAFALWWYNSDLATKQRWFNAWGGFDSEIGWAQYLERLAEGMRRMAAVASDSGKRVSEVFPPVHSGELHVPVIDALANDNPGIFSVNVPNNGSIAGIPDNVVVEGKALVNGAGIQLLGAGKLPERLMIEILWPRWIEMERDLAAYLSGDRDLLREIVLRDHRTTSYEQAERALDALLARPYNRDLAEHFAHDPLKDATCLRFIQRAQPVAVS
jgi:alpha-galactosidase